MENTDNKMMKSEDAKTKTVETVENDFLTDDYFFPAYGKTIKASSLEEANRLLQESLKNKTE